MTLPSFLPTMVKTDEDFCVLGGWGGKVRIYGESEVWFHWAFQYKGMIRTPWAQTVISHFRIARNSRIRILRPKVWEVGGFNS